jgi:hypothetical protein
MDDDLINMRLHEVELTHYDPRANILAAIALDDNTPPKAAARLLREAEKIYKRARACAPRPTGTINVRASVIDVLRRIGGAR